jgi:oligopeptide transport system ATP-binding protein
MSNEDTLVQIRNLKKYFPITQGILVQRQIGAVKAVDGVSLDIRRGETLGLVGESGCGKTTMGRTLLKLYQPTEGKVIFDGIDLAELSDNELRKLRSRMQMMVQLDPMHLNRYPHEFSGGQRQRIGIARALASDPEFIVCDEPISALDVSIQAQVVNLLEDLQEKFDLTYLFIAHDLSMVRHICDRVAMMYLGTIVEFADREELYSNPLHPYSIALLSAVPIPDPRTTRARQRIVLEGDPPSPSDPPSGCRFHPRCELAKSHCKEEIPQLREVAPNHFVACHEVG